jgi:hypothetical protein
MGIGFDPQVYLRAKCLNPYLLLKDMDINHFG